MGRMLSAGLLRPTSGFGTVRCLRCPIPRGRRDGRHRRNGLLEDRRGRSGASGRRHPRIRRVHVRRAVRAHESDRARSACAWPASRRPGHHGVAERHPTGRDDTRVLPGRVLFHAGQLASRRTRDRVHRQRQRDEGARGRRTIRRRGVARRARGERAGFAPVQRGCGRRVPAVLAPRRRAVRRAPGRARDRCVHVLHVGHHWAAQGRSARAARDRPRSDGRRVRRSVHVVRLPTPRRQRAHHPGAALPHRRQQLDHHVAADRSLGRVDGPLDSRGRARTV